MFLEVAYQLHHFKTLGKQCMQEGEAGILTGLNNMGF